MKICNCTLPYNNPKACDNCNNNIDLKQAVPIIQHKYNITKEQESRYDLKKVRENIKLLQDREKQLESELKQFER